MFGRKKKLAEEAEPDDDFEDTDDAGDEDLDADADDLDEGGDETGEDGESSDQDETGDDDDEEEAEDEPEDEWMELDSSRDWREDGPFDISEVDLDADDLQRLDFGSLVVTPFDDMQMQMQVDQATNQVQALLVMDGDSAIEVALFAAPARASMLPEVRADMQAATDKADGTMSLVEGPLGTEIRRRLPVTAPDGRQGHQVTRTWLAQGPKWLLRGVLMGKAALTDDVDEGEAQLLFEFFCNLVVRRGDTPRVPGQLIGLDIPKSVLEHMAKAADK